IDRKEKKASVVTKRRRPRACSSQNSAASPTTARSHSGHVVPTTAAAICLSVTRPLDGGTCETYARAYSKVQNQKFLNTDAAARTAQVSPNGTAAPTNSHKLDKAVRERRSRLARHSHRSQTTPNSTKKIPCCFIRNASPSR